MAAPNIIGATTIYGGTSVLSITTTATAIISNLADSGKHYKINTIIVSNIDGSNAHDVTVDFYRNSVSYKLVSTVSVPADTSFTPLDKSLSIYVEEGDSIRLSASSNGVLQAVCSYEEISG
jgi:hypothetical protein